MVKEDIEKLSNKRIVYYDVLNIISIIAVIIMHCNGIVHGNPNIRAWDTSLLVDCLLYFAVPVFVMVSGATLMNYRKKYDTKTFFKKRFLKVFIPFLFWQIGMMIWKIFVTKSMKISNTVDFFNAFFTNRAEPTYYFLFYILGVYLTMPILSLLTEEKHRKTLWFTVALYFVFNSLIPNLLQLAKINWNTNFSVLLGGYVIFVILGYLLSTQDIKKKYRIMIYIGAIIGLVYRYAITFVISKKTGTVYKNIWTYNSWYAILLAASVFLLAKYTIGNKEHINEKLVKILATISGCSFGIYLVHRIVMRYEVRWFAIDEYSWQWRTLGAIATYLICLIIVYIIKKIPLLKKVVP